MWGASHVRSVLEMAWECIVIETDNVQTEYLLQAVDPHTVARWLPAQ